MDNLKNYFENANKSLQKVDELKKTINVLKGKLTTFSNKKEELETKKNELIAKTIYEKKTDIEKSYSEVLLEAEKRLQVAKNEKEKEKKKNIEMLVENKTKNIKENNQYLKNEIKRLLKDNKMPCFVNTTAYFTLFSPYTFLQFVGGLFTMLLIIAMPSIICFFIMKNKMMEIFPNEIIRTIMVILFYSVWILIFGSLWLFIEKISKKNAEALKDIKELRKNIKDNDKEVEVITNQVAKEIKDEDFDYTKLDREIESISIDTY